MKMLEKRPSMRKVTEHIEMKLLASEEPCTVVLVQDAEEDYCSYYKHLEHPLVSDAEEEYPVPHVQTPPQQHFNLKRVLSVGTEDLDDCHLAPDLNEDMEIELEEFPPFNTSQSDRVVKTSGVPSFRTPIPVPSQPLVHPRPPSNQYFHMGGTFFHTVQRKYRKCAWKVKLPQL